MSRPGAFKNAALKLGVLATAPLVIAAASTAAFGQGEKLPRKIVEVLNFALTLEYLEDEFYRTGLASDKLIPSETRATFELIGKHEAAHVEVLKAALGEHAVKKPEFDYTAKSAFADVFSNYKTFLAVSHAIDDTGVRAYKGQAGNLKSSDEILTVALQIHSVEARHAAAVRLIRGNRRGSSATREATCLKRLNPSTKAKLNTKKAAPITRILAASRPTR